jgi:hypothetical protein
MNKLTKVERERYSKPEYTTPDEISGELIQSWLPKVDITQVSGELIFATLDLDAIEAGKKLLEVRHHINFKDRGRSFYSTTLSNRSNESIRIDRFASYSNSGKVYLLHTRTGGFYSAQQFREWYGMGLETAISPGQTVTDPINHSPIGCYWAYFGTTESGKQIVGGARWTGKSWWQF